MTAGLLLTGGASRRMGADKALIELPGGSQGRQALAARTGRLLSEVAHPVFEIGPGASGLPAVPDPVAHAGPLAAMATGAGALAGAGCQGWALVVATDLPFLTVGLLRWLAEHPAPSAVVPVDTRGHPQVLCARYRLDDLLAAKALSAAGAKAARALLDVIEVAYAPPADWLEAAGRPDALDDVDTPEDLAAARGRLAGPEAPSERGRGPG